MALPKKYGKWSAVYVKFSSWSKNITITKILAATKKQKLFNEEDSILFIDSTIIQASPNTNKNQDNQKQNIDR